MTTSANDSYMISLGGYRFESTVNPLHAKSKSKSYTYANRPRWKGVDAFQFKGRPPVEITLDVKVVVTKRDDRDVMPNLEILGDSGEPLKLISPSEGGYMGLWVITAFSSNESVFTRSGIGLLQTGSITIKEYVE